MIDLPRGHYFAVLFFIAFGNGLIARLVHSVLEVGWAEAFARTFDISVIVLAACAAGIYLITRDRTRGISKLELSFAVVFIACAFQPIGQLNLVAATALGLYMLATTDIPTSRRGAIILLASTVPLVWSRALFYYLSNYILAADAWMVSLFLGTHRAGNLVEFADHSGQLAIWAPCSSLANVSLAFLCWVAMTQFLGSKSNPIWCVIACLAVIVVNVARITFLGFSRWNYETFHNPLGDSIADGVVLILIVWICTFGVRRELADYLSGGESVKVTT